MELPQGPACAFRLLLIDQPSVQVMPAPGIQPQATSHTSQLYHGSSLSFISLAYNSLSYNFEHCKFLESNLPSSILFPLQARASLPVYLRLPTTVLQTRRRQTLQFEGFLLAHNHYKPLGRKPSKHKRHTRSGRS